MHAVHATSRTIVYLEADQLQALRKKARIERISGIEDAFAFDRRFLAYRYGSSRHRAFHL